jgi:hypothetical protein
LAPSQTNGVGSAAVTGFFFTVFFLATFGSALPRLACAEQIDVVNNKAIKSNSGFLILILNFYGCVFLQQNRNLDGGRSV